MAKQMLNAFLTFFDAIGPVLSILCLKDVDPDLKDKDPSFGMKFSNHLFGQIRVCAAIVNLYRELYLKNLKKEYRHYS